MGGGHATDPRPRSRTDNGRCAARSARAGCCSSTKGALSGGSLQWPLAAPLDEYEQRPPRDARRSAAAPLISGVSTGETHACSGRASIVSDRARWRSLRSGEAKARPRPPGRSVFVQLGRLLRARRDARFARSGAKAKLQRDGPDAERPWRRWPRPTPSVARRWRPPRRSRPCVSVGVRSLSARCGRGSAQAARAEPRSGSLTTHGPSGGGRAASVPTIAGRRRRRGQRADPRDSGIGDERPKCWLVPRGATIRRSAPRTRCRERKRT
jgi:hypothetical protein